MGSVDSRWGIPFHKRQSSDFTMCNPYFSISCRTLSIQSTNEGASLPGSETRPRTLLRIVQSTESASRVAAPPTARSASKSAPISSAQGT
eukprot:5693434-Prymnesium_polylepis.1